MERLDRVSERINQRNTREGKGKVISHLSRVFWANYGTAGPYVALLMSGDAMAGKTSADEREESRYERGKGEKRRGRDK